LAQDRAWKTWERIKAGLQQGELQAIRGQFGAAGERKKMSL